MSISRPQRATPTMQLGRSVGRRDRRIRGRRWRVAVASVLPKCVAVAALAFIIALAVAACGETKDESSANAPKSSGERTTTTRETATATTETEAEAAPDPDTDGDGTADADDYAPKNPKIQDESQKDDCDVLGINATKLREGSCKTDKGMRIKVVNR